jgi:hypothetical protein
MVLRNEDFPSDFVWGTLADDCVAAGVDLDRAP